MRGVRCAGHGRNAQEARAGVLGLVPGVRAEWGCYVGGSKDEIDLEVTLGLCNSVSVGQRLPPVKATIALLGHTSKAVIADQPRKHPNGKFQASCQY